MADYAGRSPKFTEGRAAMVLVIGSAVCRDLLRSYLASIDSLEVVAEAGSVAHGLAAIRRYEPDVSVCGLGASIAALSRAAQEAAGSRLRTRLVGLPCPGDLPETAARRLPKGVSVVSPAAGIAGLLASLAGALPPGDARGQLIAMAERERSDARARREPEGRPAERVLTARQQQVVELVAEGQSSKQIARALGLSRRTVESHRTNAIRRLGVRTTGELVSEAMRRGLIR